MVSDVLETRNLSFSTYHKISCFGIYLEYNQLVCLIMARVLYKFLISPFQNSILPNIIELRHFSVFHLDARARLNRNRDASFL